MRRAENLKSTHHWLERRAAISPAQLAVASAEGEVSYAELAKRSEARAAQLTALGLGPGEIAAVLLENGLAFVEITHAIARCGAALLPLNPRLTDRELAFQLCDSGARFLLFEEGKLSERALDAARQAPHTQPIPIDPPPPPVDLRNPALPVDRERPLAILYTSGTSGAPKGACLTHENFFWSAVASSRLLGAVPTDRWLVCMPLSHVGGLSILMRSVIYGTAAIIQHRFDAVAVNNAIDSEGASVVSLVATMLDQVLSARGNRPPPPSLRLVLVGGGPVPSPLIARAQALGFPVAPSYGLTEATSQVATRPPDRDLQRGLEPLPYTQIRILRENGSDASIGEEGEILVRGRTVMRGYLPRPGETGTALRNGWLHTGDIGVLDETGGLQVLERRSDLIVSGGENIYPAEIEAALLEHSAIADAGVAGVSDSQFGQRPQAWLVLNTPNPPSPEELRAFCRSRIAGYKIPAVFHFTKSLPKTASGKLLRRRLVADSTANGG